MRVLQLVDLSATHEEIGDELEAALLRVARSQRYVGGPEIATFEEAFANFLGARHAIGVANGTDALQLTLLATGIGRDDEVLIPANTFIATAEAAVAIGAVPRFVDVDSASGLLDLGSAAERVTDRTKAIVPVHLYGRMVDMDMVVEFAERHQIAVVEDAAQAHGAHRNGRRAGTVGEAGSFSFYPGKNLGAMGDAGAVVTSSDEIADRARLLRDHGRRGRDVHEVAGFNSRLDPMQAAVLSVKLRHLTRWTEARRRVAAAYRDGLGDLLDTAADFGAASVHHLFPIMSDERDRLAEELRGAGVATGVHYRHALPKLPAFAWSNDSCPVAEQRARRQLSLPMHPHLSTDDIERVITGIRALTPASG